MGRLPPRGLFVARQLAGLLFDQMKLRTRGTVHRDERLGRCGRLRQRVFTPPLHIHPGSRAPIYQVGHHFTIMMRRSGRLDVDQGIRCSPIFVGGVAGTSQSLAWRSSCAGGDDHQCTGNREIFDERRSLGLVGQVEMVARS